MDVSFYDKDRPYIVKRSKHEERYQKGPPLDELQGASRFIGRKLAISAIYIWQFTNTFFSSGQVPSSLSRKLIYLVLFSHRDGEPNLELLQV
jgi:hypothetical protein